MIEKVIIPATLSLIGGINNNTNIHTFSDYENLFNTVSNIKEREHWYFSVEELKKEKIPTKKEIEERVIRIIVNILGVAENEVTQNTSFINDLGADSLDIVELIIEFEKEFNIAIPDNIVERISTVGQSINIINEIINDSVIFYSDIKFKGETIRRISNFSPYKWSNYKFIEGGLSSIKIPKGYLVSLYSELNYKGSKITIDATKRKQYIKDLSKIKSQKNISISGSIENWNDKVKSVKIENNRPLSFL